MNLLTFTCYLLWKTGIENRSSVANNKLSVLLSEFSTQLVTYSVNYQKRGGEEWHAMLLMRCKGDGDILAGLSALVCYHGVMSYIYESLSQTCTAKLTEYEHIMILMKRALKHTLHLETVTHHRVNGPLHCCQKLEYIMICAMISQSNLYQLYILNS